MSIMTYESFVEIKINEGLFSTVLNFVKNLKGSKDITNLSRQYEQDMKALMTRKLDIREDAITKKVAYNKDQSEENKTQLDDAEKTSQDAVESIQNEAKSRTELFTNQINKVISKNKVGKDKLTLFGSIEKNKSMINVFKFEQEALKKYGDMDSIKKRNADIKAKMGEIKTMSSELSNLEDNVEDSESFDYKKDDEIYYLNDKKSNVAPVTVQVDNLDANKKLHVKTKKGTDVYADLNQLSRDEKELKGQITKQKEETTQPETQSDNTEKIENKPEIENQ